MKQLLGKRKQEAETAQIRNDEKPKEEEKVGDAAIEAGIVSKPLEKQQE